MNDKAPPPPYTDGITQANGSALRKGVPAQVTHSSSRLVLPASDGKLYVDPYAILYLKADRNYTYVHCDGGQKHLVSVHLHALEKHLPQPHFFRCHHSYLVNLAKVERLLQHAGHRIQFACGETIGVARRRWTALLRAMVH